MQAIFLPAWTLGLISIFQLQDIVKVAYLLIACAPGGHISNLWCFITGSDLSISIAMSTASTLVCLGFM